MLHALIVGSRGKRLRIPCLPYQNHQGFTMDSRNLCGLGFFLRKIIIICLAWIDNEFTEKFKIRNSAQHLIHLKFHFPPLFLLTLVLIVKQPFRI